MKLQHHPELLERLAASYALGTLRGPARRRFESMAREDASVRAAALTWQGRLSSMNELQPSAQPAPAVWTRIDNLVQAEHNQDAILNSRNKLSIRDATNLSNWLSSLTVWRLATATTAFAAVLAITLGASLRAELGTEISRLQNQLQASPRLEYVAVLSDHQSAASMLVTFDPKSSKLTLQRLGDYSEGNDRSLQLWALSPSGVPRSLGVLGQDQVLRLATGESAIREVPTLAISLEPKGGVPSATGPTGPVLFKGSLIRRMM